MERRALVVFVVSAEPADGGLEPAVEAVVGVEVGLAEHAHIVAGLGAQVNTEGVILQGGSCACSAYARVFLSLLSSNFALVVLYWASQQLVGRAFVCLLIELVSQPNQASAALLSTVTAGSGKALNSWIVFQNISLYKLMDCGVGMLNGQ